MRLAIRVALACILVTACRERARPAPPAAPSAPAFASLSAAPPAAMASGAAPASATASSAPPSPAAPFAAAPLRGDWPTPTEAAKGGKADELVILMGGDVNLGRGCGQNILRDPRYDPFREIAPLLRTADIRFVNLESQLSDQHGETQSPFIHMKFTGPPGGAEVLKRAGIDIVSLANNHVWDYGGRAFRETLANLRRAEVAYVGVSDELDRQYEPTILDVKGWRVAWFAVTDVWNRGKFESDYGKDYVAWARFDRMRQGLERARKENDVVILSYHGGGEYLEVPMAWTRFIVDNAMKTGIDAFVGHHPHVPQGVGWQSGRPVFFSLGNLVFAMHSDHPWTGVSFMARMTFHRDGSHEVEACPYRILGHTPTPLEGDGNGAQQQAFVRHLRNLSITAGRTEIGEPNELGCVPLSAPDSARTASVPDAIQRGG